MKKKDVMEKARYENLFEKGLDMEEVITISGLERLRDSVFYGNLNNSIKKKMIKIIDHLTKDTLKHIKIFRNLMR